jgi:hypothetical protein
MSKKGFAQNSLSNVVTDREEMARMQYCVDISENSETDPTCDHGSSNPTEYFKSDWTIDFDFSRHSKESSYGFLNKPDNNSQHCAATSMLVLVDTPHVPLEFHRPGRGLRFPPSRIRISHVPLNL